MCALWRQESPLDPTFAALNRCFEEDWFLLPYELAVQRAHATALAAAGLLGAPELAALEVALGEIERSFVGAGCPATDAEDLHTWMEEQLTARAGDAGRRIHTARSRNDQVATLMRLYAIDAGTGWARRLAEITAALCRRAGDWADLALPLHTHQQFAAPGSAGLWGLRYAVSLDRVRRLLVQRVAEWRRDCPLGAGAVCGSSVPIDRTIQALALGFERPAPNALEATTTRDDALELLAAGAQLGLHLQSFATDVIVYSQTPLAIVRYPARFGTGSSMMPNKMNPDAMELLRGESCGLQAAHGELLTLLKGLPSGYNRDLQCVKPLLHRAVERGSRLLDLVLAFVADLDFDAERAAAALRLGHVNATLRMEALVTSGVPLRQAHHQVAGEVAASPDPATPLIDDPLSRYRTLGSAAPAEVRRVAAELLATLAAE